MIVRYERWGAWVRLESAELPALVALDREGVRALGLDGGEVWSDESPAPASAPLEAHVAVTRKCAVGCDGCYLDARPEGEHVPRADLERTFDALAATGVFTVAFGGGEPTTRADVGELAEAARARGLVPVLTTSGAGLGARKVDRLRAFAQVNVSYDGAGDDYARVRGVDGVGDAERAIRALAAAGVRVGVNVVLTRDTFDALGATLARARELGACEAQLLRYKPAGRAATLDYLARRLTREQARALGPTLRALHRVHEGALTLRIDCALVPFLSADPEIAAAPELLERFGVLGCEAGAALVAVRADGRVAPCSFASATELPAARFAEGHASDPTLAAWRAHADAPPEPCASCTIRAVCRGGCQVVSSFVRATRDGTFAPDPECPRVTG